MVTHSSILIRENPTDRGASWATQGHLKKVLFLINECISILSFHCS